MVDPVHEADRIRKAYWASGTPVDSIRSGSTGGWASTSSGPSWTTVSGALSKSRNEPAVIYLNADHHTHRQRFTCAHELGHHVKSTACRATH